MEYDEDIPEQGKERYFDFCDDDDLLNYFNSSGVSGWYLKDQAELITHYLEYRNPANRIAGLLAHHSAVSAGIHRTLVYVKWIMVANTALVSYIVYKAF